MPQISRRASTAISFAIAIIFFASLIFLTAIMPTTVNTFISMKPQVSDPLGIGDGAHVIILVITYLIILLAAATDVNLMIMLHDVRRGMVFTDRNVACIRAMSWFCIIASPLFGLLAYWFLVSAGVGFVAFFVGLCLRVVKNSFEEAIAIKNENDLTI